jgi:hypothetical protein
MLYRCATVALALAGCANAGTHAGDDQQVDAPRGQVDAPMGDAPCVPVTTELLVNGNFDSAPEGTGWTETPSDPTVKLVTTDDGITEDTPTEKVWLGGYPGTAVDTMYQDLAIPAGTTMIVFTGKYDVATTETGTTVKDTATLKLETTSGQALDTISSLDNAHATTTWTAIDHTIPVTGLAGQTVRLKFRSSLDSANNTNFFFDTLSLQVTHCP